MANVVMVGGPYQAAAKPSAAGQAKGAAGRLTRPGSENLRLTTGSDTIVRSTRNLPREVNKPVANPGTLPPEVKTPDRTVHGFSDGMQPPTGIIQGGFSFIRMLVQVQFVINQTCDKH